MNRKLEEALKDQELKKKAKKSVSRAVINEANLADVFIKPFAPVFKGLKIFSKDVLSNVMMMTGQVFTLSPEKRKKRRENYKKRQEKIEAQWKPLLDNADKHLKSGDANIFGFAFSPGLYMATKFGGATYDAARGIGSYLDDLGLKKGILSVLPGVSVSVQETGDDSSKKSKESDDSGSLLDKLNKLFLGTAIASTVAGNVLKQQSKKSKSDNSNKTSKKESTQRKVASILTENKDQIIKDMGEFLEDTGLSDEFAKMQKSLFEYFEEVIADYDEIVKSKKDLVEQINQSKDLNSMFDALKKLSGGDSDINSETLKIQKNFEESKNKLIKSKEFVEKVKEEFKKEDLSEEEVEKAAEKIIFSDFVTQMKNDSDEKIKAMITELGEDLKELLPSEETLAMVQKSKEGLSFFNMIRDAKTRYNIS